MRAIYRISGFPTRSQPCSCTQICNSLCLLPMLHALVCRHFRETFSHANAWGDPTWALFCSFCVPRCSHHPRPFTCQPCPSLPQRAAVTLSLPRCSWFCSSGAIPNGNSYQVVNTWKQPLAQGPLWRFGLVLNSLLQFSHYCNEGLLGEPTSLLGLMEFRTLRKGLSSYRSYLGIELDACHCILRWYLASCMSGLDLL